jgi:hypothetical protein
VVIYQEYGFVVHEEDLTIGGKKNTGNTDRLLLTGLAISTGK